MHDVLVGAFHSFFVGVALSLKHPISAHEVTPNQFYVSTINWQQRLYCAKHLSMHLLSFHNLYVKHKNTGWRYLW
jgi:hypothetical protein